MGVQGDMPPGSFALCAVGFPLNSALGLGWPLHSTPQLLLSLLLVLFVLAARDLPSLLVHYALGPVHIQRYGSVLGPLLVLSFYLYTAY
jgi:hypothetical protein